MSDKDLDQRREEYAEKRQRRVDRLQARAENRRAEGEAHRQKSDEIAKRFWMGQPILIGHHSEKGARRDQERIHNNMRKYIAKDAEANELERRAAAAERNTAVYADDPDAVDKLKEKLAGLERAQEAMKRRNRIVRGKKLSREEKVTKLVADGMDEHNAQALFVPQWGDSGPIGYPAYRLQNNNAQIRRLRKRIEELERQQTAKHTEEEVATGVTLERDPLDARIRLRFPDKPSEVIRKLLKSNGFRWSPRNVAWQRQLNGNGEWAVERVLPKIKEAYNA